MDHQQFDRITRVLGFGTCRRAAIKRLGGGALAFFLSQLGFSAIEAAAEEVGAERRKKRRRKKQKLQFNAFDCVNVGGFCKTSGQCCSGICAGKKDKKTCRAHDVSTCQPGQDVCLGVVAACLPPDGVEAVCTTTTGNASYCAASNTCFACTKDADCEPICGQGAACVVCTGECAKTGGTACVGATAGSCNAGV